MNIEIGFKSLKEANAEFERLSKLSPASIILSKGIYYVEDTNNPFVRSWEKLIKVTTLEEQGKKAFEESIDYLIECAR